jgi:hypothetical protein
VSRRAVLGEVEVAEDAAEDRDAAGSLVPVRTGEVVAQWTTTGRTSIVPVRAVGIRDAQSIASSSDSASTR